jgi:CRP-like cAMP-binding protein
MSDTTTPKDAFIAEIATYQPLEPAAESFVREHLSVTEYRKNDILLSIGEVNDRLYFVHKGLARGYYSFEDEEGEKQKASSLFAAESHFIISPSSFLRQQSSREGIELLENSTLASLSYEDLQNLYGTFSSSNSIQAQVTERYLLYYAKRDEAFRFSTGEERYRWFLAIRPELGRGRVSYRDIASYINLSEKAFTRIRKQMV